MEDREIRNIWKESNGNLEEKMDLLVDQIMDHKSDKAKSMLNGLLIRRIPP